MAVKAITLPSLGQGQLWSPKGEYHSCRRRYSGFAAWQAKIQLGLEAESVSVTDTYGDGRHVSIAVVSNVFEGQSSVKRQRMVYKVIFQA